ncbi:TPA: TrbI F-type domain-containing protein [Legionella bozemanae]
MRLIHLALVFSLLILVSGSAFYYGTSRSPIVFLDKEAIQGQVIRQLAELNANESQVKRTTRRFSDALNYVLTQHAKNNKTVILGKNCVLAGGVDITNEVTFELSELMRKKS